ncbi:hypothetical protein B0189_07185 [Moraxella cuniculi]|nr:hypothetical protein B0189_07185 [Moraxella cuniculi]
MVRVQLPLPNPNQASQSVGLIFLYQYRLIARWQKLSQKPPKNSKDCVIFCSKMLKYTQI